MTIRKGYFSHFTWSTNARSWIQQEGLAKKFKTWSLGITTGTIQVIYSKKIRKFLCSYEWKKIVYNNITNNSKLQKKNVGFYAIETSKKEIHVYLP